MVDVGDFVYDMVQFNKEFVVVVMVEMWYVVGDYVVGEFFVGSYVQVMIVEEGVVVFFCCVEFIGCWIEYDVCDDFVVVFECDGDCELWNVVQEVCCVVEWIDDLVMCVVGVFDFVVFFVEEVIGWMCFQEFVFDDFFSFVVGLGDVVVWFFD